MLGRSLKGRCSQDGILVSRLVWEKPHASSNAASVLVQRGIARQRARRRWRRRRWRRLVRIRCTFSEAAADATASSRIALQDAAHTVSVIDHPVRVCIILLRHGRSGAIRVGELLRRSAADRP
nr:hypothetical protein CFP56_63019 [Quercus suber]